MTRDRTVTEMPFAGDTRYVAADNDLGGDGDGDDERADERVCLTRRDLDTRHDIGEGRRMYKRERADGK